MTIPTNPTVPTNPTTTPTSSSADTFPLAFASRGETVTLIEIRANDKLHKRLVDLGLNIGMRVRVVQADASGALILAVQNDARLAIGLSMAQKIMVKRCEGNA